MTATTESYVYENLNNWLQELYPRTFSMLVEYKFPFPIISVPSTLRSLMSLAIANVEAAVWYDKTDPDEFDPSMYPLSFSSDSYE